jgi:hypothetical protein
MDRFLFSCVLVLVMLAIAPAANAMPVLRSRRLRWTAAFVIISSALVLAVGWSSGSEQLTRRPVTVQPLRAAYHGPSALVAALKGDDVRARARAR